MVTVPAQRDVGGDSALLGEVAMPISVSCPSVLPLTSLQGLRGEQALPFVWHRQENVGPWATSTCLGASAACATRQGRAGP